MKSKFTAWSSALVLGTVASVGFGADDSEIRAELEAMRGQLKEQQAEIQRLRSESGDTWLNERRAEEVRTLVHEVISDADGRASFVEGGLTAGHRDGHFFIASDDGNFLLQPNGWVQSRYIWNYRNETFADPEQRRHTRGFEITRAKLGFQGHVFDPRLTYGVRGNFTPDRRVAQVTDEFAFPIQDGVDVFGERDRFSLEEAWFGFEFADGWQIKGGQFKAPFLREELVYSKNQLAIERSAVSQLFTAGYAQGLQLGYTADMFRAHAMFHDGGNSANTSFNRTPAQGARDFALAGRVEALLAGSWAQFADFTTWTDDEFGLMLGAAVNYENAAGGGFIQQNDVLAWTVDASVEAPQAMGFNAFAAVIGNHPQSRGQQSTGATNVDQWGLVGQAGVYAIPDTLEVFGRWEYLDLMDQTTDGAMDINSSKTHTLTVGTNYYLYGHSAKASLDLVWLLDPSPFGFTDQGVLPSGDRDQLAVRTQFQFAF